MISGTISLPLSGYFSPFPHGTYSLSVTFLYLALVDGPTKFLQGSTCPVVLGCIRKENENFNLLGFHRLRPIVPNRSANFHFFDSSPDLLFRELISLDPDITTPAGLHYISLGFSPFARHYLGNHFCFLFLQVLRCFNSLGFASLFLCIQKRMTYISICRIAPFRNLRIIVCQRLSEAYRSLPRLSSP